MFTAYGTDEDDQLSFQEARHVIRRAVSLLRPYRRSLVVAGCTAVLWTASILAGPLLVIVLFLALGRLRRRSARAP